MKKLLIALLALGLVAGAFAQGVVAIGASGEVTLYDTDGVATFARDGSGYDLLSFKGSDKDGKWGFNATYDNFLSDNALESLNQVRNWEAWYKVPYTKVILGKVRNGDFRTLAAEGWIGSYGHDRWMNKEYGVALETTDFGPFMGGFAMAIPEAGADFADVLKTSRIGLQYAMEGIGTFNAMIHLDTLNDANYFQAGADITAIENLGAQVFVSYLQADPDPTIEFGVSAYYTLDKLYAGVEFEGQNTADLLWDVVAHADYTIIDNVTGTVEVQYYSDKDAYVLPEAYDAFGKISYDFANGLTTGLKVGYNGETYYALTLGYEIAF